MILNYVSNTNYTLPDEIMWRHRWKISRDWQDYTQNPGIWASVIFGQKIQMCLGTSGSVISGQKIQRELLYPDLGIFLKILSWELS